jgi:hypothetical protein
MLIEEWVSNVWQSESNVLTNLVKHSEWTSVQLQKRTDMWNVWHGTDGNKDLSLGLQWCGVISDRNSRPEVYESGWTEYDFQSFPSHIGSIVMQKQKLSDGLSRRTICSSFIKFIRNYDQKVRKVTLKLAFVFRDLCQWFVDQLE